MRDEQFAQVDELNSIESQRFNRGPSGSRNTHDLEVVGCPCEVVRPLLPPWMEQRHELAGDGIVAFDLGVFVIVTALTRQSEICRGCLAASAFGDDVFDGERLR